MKIILITFLMLTSIHSFADDDTIVCSGGMSKTGPMYSTEINGDRDEFTFLSINSEFGKNITIDNRKYSVFHFNDVEDAKGRWKQVVFSYDDFAHPDQLKYEVTIYPGVNHPGTELVLNFVRNGTRTAYAAGFHSVSLGLPNIETTGDENNKSRDLKIDCKFLKTFQENKATYCNKLKKPLDPESREWIKDYCSKHYVKKDFMFPKGYRNFWEM